MFRTLRALALGLSFVLSASLITAPAAPAFANTLAPTSVNSPEYGEFDTVLYRSRSGQHAVLRIQYPQLGQRIELVQKTGSRTTQLFRFTLSESDLGADGTYKSLIDGNLTRVFPLRSTNTTLQVRVDGKDYLEPKTLSRTKTRAVQINRVLTQASAETVTGQGEFSSRMSNLMEGSRVLGWCPTFNASPLAASNIRSVELDGQTVRLNQEGCYVADSGFLPPAAEFKVVYDTKVLADGFNEFGAEARLVNDVGAKFSARGNTRFITDNYSLGVTAPQPTARGVFQAGQVITIDPGNWGTGVTFVYKWFSNGELIRAANSARYFLTQADVGRTLAVEVTGQRNEADKAVRRLELTQPIIEQQQGQPSQGSVFSTQTSYNVREEASVYNSVERKFEIKEVNNYDVVLSYPSVLICDSSTGSFSSTCRFSVTGSWSGLIREFESFSQSVILLGPNGVQLDSRSLFLSSTRPSSTLEFAISPSQARSAGSGSMSLLIRSARSSQALTLTGSNPISLVSTSNNRGAALITPPLESAIRQTQSSFAYRGGTATNPHWTLWKYTIPQQMRALQTCAIIPVFIAPVSLVGGSLNDQSTRAAADAKISVFGPRGELREQVSIIGSRGDWNTMVVDNRLDIKVCGLQVRKDVRETLRVQIDLRYDAYNLESISSATQNIFVTGHLRFTSINCFKGEAGMTVTAYKPKCPEEWTQTRARIVGGRVEMKTINCLAGTDVKVIRHPEPVCPEGYEVTNLRVRDGKLVPWTIQCRKGFLLERVTGVFPSCPAGYRRI